MDLPYLKMWSIIRVCRIHSHVVYVEWCVCVLSDVPIEVNMYYDDCTHHQSALTRMIWRLDQQHSASMCWYASLGPHPRSSPHQHGSTCMHECPPYLSQSLTRTPGHSPTMIDTTTLRIITIPSRSSFVKISKAARHAWTAAIRHIDDMHGKSMSDDITLSSGQCISIKKQADQDRTEAAAAPHGTAAVRRRRRRRRRRRKYTPFACLGWCDSNPGTAAVKTDDDRWLLLVTDGEYYWWLTVNTTGDRYDLWSTVSSDAVSFIHMHGLVTSELSLQERGVHLDIVQKQLDISDLISRIVWIYPDKKRLRYIQIRLDMSR